MRARLITQVLVVLLATLVVAAVVHTSTDFDSCLWNGTSHRSASHSSHACQVCGLGSWALTANSPAVAPVDTAVLLDLPGSHLWRPADREESSAPRAPPVLPA